MWIRRNEKWQKARGDAYAPTGRGGGQICGSKSGRDVDKSQLFHNFYGELENAPMIRECPFNMECRVSDVIDYDPNKGIIGEVVRSYADPAIMVEGVVDMRKAQLIAWTAGDDFGYYCLGEKIVLPSDLTD